VQSEKSLFIAVGTEMLTPEIFSASASVLQSVNGFAICSLPESAEAAEAADEPEEADAEEAVAAEAAADEPEEADAPPPQAVKAAAIIVQIIIADNFFVFFILIVLSTLFCDFLFCLVYRQAWTNVARVKIFFCAIDGRVRQSPHRQHLHIL